MASIYSNNMREVMDGLAEAAKAIGKEDEFFDMAIEHLHMAFQTGLVELDDVAEDPCLYSWMFPEDFDELDVKSQVMIENARAVFYKAGMMLLGRDVIAEMNPGRSKGYIEFIRRGPQPDEDGQLYSRKRLREFNEVIGDVMEQRGGDHPVVEELCAIIEESGRDFSHPAPDAVMTWALQRARSMTNDGIRERAAKGLQALQKRIKV
jgi:hypothetical protein